MHAHKTTEELHHARGAVGSFAARALGRQLDQRAVPILLAALADPQLTPQVRHSILAALVSLRAPEAIAGLIAEFSDADQNNIAHQAARLLAVFGEPALAALEYAQRSTDWRVRTCTVIALAEMRSPSACSMDRSNARSPQRARARWCGG